MIKKEKLNKPNNINKKKSSDKSKNMIDNKKIEKKNVFLLLHNIIIFSNCNLFF